MHLKVPCRFKEKKKENSKKLHPRSSSEPCTLSYRIQKYSVLNAGEKNGAICRNEYDIGIFTSLMNFRLPVIINDEIYFIYSMRF